MKRHILFLAALAAVACKEESKQATPRPQPQQEPSAAPVPTSPVVVPTEAPTAVPTVANTGGGNPSPVTASELEPPTTWDSAAPVVGAAGLAAEVQRLYAQAMKFDIQLPQFTGVTLPSLESRAETCARSVLDSMKFEATQSQFSIVTQQNFKACMDASQTQNLTTTETSFAHNMNTRCQSTNFAPLNNQKITSQQVQTTLCKTAPKADLFFNVQLSTKDTSATTQRTYKRIKAFQSSQAGDCTYTTENNQRVWQDCQWVDIATKNAKGFKYSRVKYNGAKADLTETGMTFTEGKLDVVVDKWQGEIVFGGPKPVWTLRNNQGQTQSGQLD